MGDPDDVSGHDRTRVHELRELCRLLVLVSQMPKPMRQVFTLRKVYGMTHLQIADHMDMSLEQVQRHLACALLGCAAALSIRVYRFLTMTFLIIWFPVSKSIRRNRTLH